MMPGEGKSHLKKASGDKSCLKKVESDYCPFKEARADKIHS